MEAIVVFVTAKDLEEGRRVARGLLEDRLAACVNIVGSVESHYWWEDKLEEAQECLLIVKSMRAHLDALVERVKSLHSYTVPETVAMQVCGGNADYLSWVQTETRTGAAANKSSA